MKITEFSAVRNISSPRRRGKTSETSSNFADFLDVGSADETAHAAQLSDVAGSAAVGNMLVLQEISEEEIERKKLIKKGKNLIDTLDGLRQQLLIGSVPLSTLHQLKQQLSVQKQMTSDPRLLALIDDIELRAAVELAKLEMAVAASSSLPAAEE